LSRGGSSLRPLPEGSEGGVFYLFGEDAFRKEEAVRELVRAHLDPATRDFNLDQLKGTDVSVEALASVLGTPPLMALRRVVVLREVEGLAGQPRAREILLGAVQRPPPSLVLILSAALPAGSRARFYDDLRKGTRWAEFRAMGAEDAPGWLMERAREQHGRALEEAAAVALAAALGPELGLLSMELEKLHAVAPPGEPITLAVVELAGTSLPRQNRWDWFDMVGEARLLEALRTLPVLLGQSGETPVGLVSGLATQLLRVGVAVEVGTAALEAQLPPRQQWLARKVAGQARHWTGEEVERALQGLLEVDRELKSTGGDAEGSLERWLLELLARRRSVAA